MSEFLDIAVRAAREAGNLLLEKQGQGFSVEKKGDVDLVTDADRDSEALIRKIIFEKFPGSQFYGRGRDYLQSKIALSLDSRSSRWHHQFRA